jgi:hypothetical protein
MLPVWLLTSRSPDWFAGRGRPRQAAARRAGLDGVEKLLPTNLTAPTLAERGGGMLRVPVRRLVLVDWLPAPGCASSGRPRRCLGQAQPESADRDLDCQLRLPQLEPIERVTGLGCPTTWKLVFNLGSR